MTIKERDRIVIQLNKFLAELETNQIVILNVEKDVQPITESLTISYTRRNKSGKLLK